MLIKFYMHGLGSLARLGLPATLIKSYFDSSPRLSDLVDDLETTDRLTLRAIAAAKRIDEAIVAKVQAICVVGAR